MTTENVDSTRQPHDATFTSAIGASPATNELVLAAFFTRGGSGSKNPPGFRTEIENVNIVKAQQLRLTSKVAGENEPSFISFNGLPPVSWSGAILAICNISSDAGSLGGIDGTALFLPPSGSEPHVICVIAETPSVSPAFDAVRNYKTTHMTKLSPEDAQTLSEVARRLERLELLAADLIKLNNKLWAAEDFRISFDPETETLTVAAGDSVVRYALARPDPNMRIVFRGLSATSAYNAAETTANEERVLRIELENKLESYYLSAHRVLKLLGTIRNLGKIRCAAVTRVRNDLIEHPRGTLYSFGVGSNGPVVKPLHQGKSDFVDSGVVPNTRDFVNAVVAGLS